MLYMHIPYFNYRNIKFQHPYFPKTQTTTSFDQGGYVEFYEYEDGGSKVTTRDGNGNILSESRTHSCSTNK